MVSHLRASRALVVVAALAAGCTVTTERAPPAPWDAAVDGVGSSSGGSGGSSTGSSSSSGAGSSGSSSGFPNVDGNACQPGNVATYQPDAYHPASGAGQGACVATASSDPIADFYAACLGSSATSESCNGFRTSQAACAACILTSAAAMKYGPLIDHGAFVTANVAGCLELLVPGALSCSKAVQALGGCELAACQANCPVHDAASLSDYEACATQAEGAGCQTYATAATCAYGVADAAPDAALCLSDFATFYASVAKLFCGPPEPAPPLDAGGASPLDAASGD